MISFSHQRGMAMEKYFSGKSISGEADSVLKKIAYRFMEDNPQTPFTYRAFNTLGFKRDEGGRSILDFDEKLPNTAEGDYAYAAAKLYSEADGICCLSISCRNPSTVYVNGKEATKTTCLDEVLNDSRAFDFPVHKGYNTVFIKSRKNALGFKCVIGCYSPKWLPVNFYTAFEENEGELGWNWCGAYKEDIFKDNIPSGELKLSEDWQPKPEKNEIYECGGKIYAVTFLKSSKEAALLYSCDEKFSLYSDGLLVGEYSDSGEIKLDTESGVHSLSFEFEKAPKHFEASAIEGELFLPEYIKGVRGNMLFIETDDEAAKGGFKEYMLYKSGSDREFFKSGKNSYIRPVLERAVYGKSNYPIGVVLYGLLTAGRRLGDEKITDYAHGHLLRCCRIKDYAEWDSEKFGCACVNHQLLHLSSLDDCGSFAASILEDYLNYSHDERLLPTVDYIGDYIRFSQERLDSGAFYRKMEGEYFQYTVWADDLYMSVPFLIRYSALKNDKSIMDDAVNQLLQFKKLLYMPDKKLMSHVYNLKFEKKTKVPWGRGNGWVLFSLSEVLLRLDKNYDKYAQVEKFFKELCEGFLSVLDSKGMCHQVLDDEKSFAEASATAMCAAAFARGVILGILPEKPYAQAAEKAVCALEKYCIDEHGNIYGVCVGSGYSFTREYYKYDLSWNVNDTHGTGIILTAVSENERMKELLSERLTQN